MSRPAYARRIVSPRWSQVMLAPFETAIAALIVVQAIISLGGWGVLNPIDELLPGWLPYMFSSAYLLAGVLVLVGLFLPRGDVEGAGLVLLSAIVVARGVLFGQLLGWGVSATTSLAFALFIAAAAVLRIMLLRATSRASSGRAPSVAISSELVNISKPTEPNGPAVARGS